MLTTYLLISLTVLFTVIGQLLVKGGMNKVGSIPSEGSAIPNFIWKAITNWKVFLGLVCAVIAALTWMGAVSNSSISFAYPFMSLAIVLVLVLSPLIFGDPVKWNNWVGVIIVCIGLFVTTR